MPKLANLIHRSGIAGSAPFVNFLGKIMYSDESSYLVNDIDKSKLKECISGDNADNAHLKFNYRVGDNVYCTLVNDYSGQVLKHCLQEKLSVARNLGIEMSEEEILNDMRRNLSPQLMFLQESDANNTALIKALISFPQTTRDAVDNPVSVENHHDFHNDSEIISNPPKNLELGIFENIEEEHPVEDPKKDDADEDEHPGSPSNKEDQEVKNARNNKKQKKVNTHARVQNDVNHNNIIEKPRTRKQRNAFPSKKQEKKK